MISQQKHVHFATSDLLISWTTDELVEGEELLSNDLTGEGNFKRCNGCSIPTSDLIASPSVLMDSITSKFKGGLFFFPEDPCKKRSTGLSNGPLILASKRCSHCSPYIPHT